MPFCVKVCVVPPALIDFEYVDGPVVLMVLVSRPEPDFLVVRLYAIVSLNPCMAVLGGVHVCSATSVAIVTFLRAAASFVTGFEID